MKRRAEWAFGSIQWAKRALIRRTNWASIESHFGDCSKQPFWLQYRYFWCNQLSEPLKSICSQMYEKIHTDKGSTLSSCSFPATQRTNTKYSVASRLEKSMWREISFHLSEPLKSWLFSHSFKGLLKRVPAPGARACERTISWHLASCEALHNIGCEIHPTWANRSNII